MLLDVQNVTLSFGGLVAVSDASFLVNEHEIVSIIGPNGAGKTTIFNILTGLYKVDSGKAFFNGENILENKTPMDIAKLGISRTFQNIRLFQSMRVVENVITGTNLHCRYGFMDAVFHTKKYRAEERKHAEMAIRILKSIGLENRIHTLAKNLPYGEQRKLEIARCLATEPKLILLDEPAAGMNPQESHELMDFIRFLRDSGYTILLIEHDMKVVMNISDRIYVFDHGKKIAEGIPEEIAHNQDVIKAYLGEEQEDAEDN